MGRKLLSLFPGLGYAAGYKVSQRIYKFGGQPWINDVLVRNYKTNFTNMFGERKGRMMMQATAGSLTGIGEVVLLPLDALKIKRQVNPDAFRGRGVVRIFMEEGTTLYRGWGWTVARNAPGSFAVGYFPPQPVSFPSPLTGRNGSAVRCQRDYEGLHPRCIRLQQGNVDAELCRLHSGRGFVYHCRSAPRHDQNSYPECQF